MKTMNSPAPPQVSVVSVEERIRRKLAAALAPTELLVRNESHLHAGHEGAREAAALARPGRPAGDTHFFIFVRSARFESMARLARHRLIYTLLEEELRDGVHSLAIDARPPEPPS